MTIPPPPGMTPPPGYTPAQPQPQPQSGKGLAITSMVLGIVSVALCVYWFLTLPLGIVAVVLGIIARGKPAGKGMALAGIITGAVGAVIGLILLVSFFTGGGVSAFQDSFMEGYCGDYPDNPGCESWNG